MLEYIDDTHQYLVDGVLVPSVSELVAYATGDIYKDVPSAILLQAADRGTKIHEAIEQDVRFGLTEKTDEDIDHALAEWVRLKNENHIEVKDMEVMVHTQDYAGRYDMIAEVNGVLTLIDIKTTLKLHERNLAVQLGLYLHAMGMDLPCACLWIPRDGEGKYVQVTPISSEECDELVNAYKNHLEPPRAANELELADIYTPAQMERIKAFYSLKDEIDAIEKEAKEKAKAIMKEKGIKSFKNDDITITYIPESTKSVVDTDKLKADGLYEKCTKTTTVKDSVRFTWQKAKEPKR